MKTVEGPAYDFVIVSDEERLSRELLGLFNTNAPRLLMSLPPWRQQNGKWQASLQVTHQVSAQTAAS